MKIIEAMKKVKANKAKILDLQGKVKLHCVNLSHETPVYGGDTKRQVEQWMQACTDLTQENVRLLLAIQRTNMATEVAIDIGGRTVKKTIAEWVWRRREYAAIDGLTWSSLGDRGLKEGQMQSTTGAAPIMISIVRHFDPRVRDEKVGMYRDEPHLIDGTLEVVNATTDLIEG